MHSDPDSHRPDSDSEDTERLVAAADRLDELADTAELMGDDPTATSMRNQAARIRMEAMNRIPPHR